jgi:hypothetical protein
MPQSLAAAPLRCASRPLACGLLFQQLVEEIQWGGDRPLCRLAQENNRGRRSSTALTRRPHSAAGLFIVAKRNGERELPCFESPNRSQLRFTWTAGDTDAGATTWTEWRRSSVKLPPDIDCTPSEIAIITHSNARRRLQIRVGSLIGTLLQNSEKLTNIHRCLPRDLVFRMNPSSRESLWC